MPASVMIVALWALAILAALGAGLAWYVAATALRAARAALANAHAHREGPPAPIVLSTGNGHALLGTPDQDPDAEVDERGEEWIKRFQPPDWGPWEDQR